MSLGSKISFFSILVVISLKVSFAEDTITSTPLINIDQIKPSFENLDEENESFSAKKNLKEKKKYKNLILLRRNL